MAADWPLKTLAECASDEPYSTQIGPFGKALMADQYVAEGVPVLRGVNVNRGRFHDDDFVFIDDKTADRLSKFESFPMDVLLVHKGTLGQIGLMPRKRKFARYIMGNSMMRVRCDSTKLLPEFLYYWLSSPAGQHYLFSRVSQVGVPQLQTPLTSLRQAVLAVPPLLEQQTIVRILGTLDDKIELNQEMRETLEAIARALFKSWFVDFDPVRARAEGRDPGLPKPVAELFPDSFEDSEVGKIPEGWRAAPLGAFFKIGIGGAWGEDEPSQRASVRVHCLRGIDCHELAEGHLPDVPVRWLSAKQAADRALTDGTIVIEASGSFCGRSLLWDSAYGVLLGEPVSYSNFCKRLSPQCTTSQAAVCWLQMRNAYRTGELNVFRTGTAFPNLDVRGILANLFVVVPTEPVAEVAAHFFRLSRRTDLMVEDKTLAVLRDTLLPRLISGDLRVNDGGSNGREQV